MLKLLRNHAQSFVLQAVVVIIAIVFIFWGVGANMNKRANAVAVVGGKEITYADFQDHYGRKLDAYKQQFDGQLPEGLAESLGLKKQVLSQLIDTELVRQGAQALGMLISDFALQHEIESMKAFQGSGGFDLATYKKVLQANHLSTSGFERSIRNDLLLARTTRMLGDFAVVSEQEVQQWLDFAGLELKLAYQIFADKDFISQVKVDEAALIAWYADKKEQYRAAPQYNFEYLFFPYMTNQPSLEVSEQEANDYYLSQEALYHRPEQRRARQIFFAFTPEMDAKAKAGLKEGAEKALAQLGKGADFASLAKAHTNDPLAKEQGGDLGLFRRGERMAAIEEAAFSLKKGAISEVVESPLGYHIVQVQEIVPAKQQAFDEVKAAIVQQLQQQKGKNQAFKQASSAYEAIMRAGSMVKYSESSGEKIHKTGLISQQKRPKDNALLQDPAFVEASFRLGKGELSSIIETSKGYAIVFVKDVQAASIPELAQIRDQVSRDYAREKSVALSQAAAEAALAQLKAKGTWAALPEKKESVYLRRDALEASIPTPLHQAAFDLSLRTSAPEKPLRLEEAWYVYSIVDRRQQKKELSATERSALKEQLLLTEKERLLGAWLSQLKARTKVWINPQFMQ